MTSCQGSSVVDSTSPSSKPQLEIMTGLPKTRLVSIVVFIHNRRMEYRPRFSPAMEATGLRREAFQVILKAFPGTEYTTPDLNGILQKYPDLDVLVHLRRRERWFIRILEDVEGDVDLWEEILNFQFPHRHVIMKRWEHLREQDARV